MTWHRIVIYRCDCSGCWACKGYVEGCTCDVDWDEMAERRLDQ